MKDYYAEIDISIKDYEEYRPCPSRKISWITNRIDWCWKFRKITQEQMTSLADRIIKVMESGDYDVFALY